MTRGIACAGWIALMLGCAAAAHAQPGPRCEPMERAEGQRWYYYYVRGRNGDLPADGSPPATFRYRVGDGGPQVSAVVAGPCFAVLVPEETTSFRANVAYWLYYYQHDAQMEVPTGDEPGVRHDNPRRVALRFRPGKEHLIASGGPRAGQLLDRSEVAPAFVGSYDRALEEMVDMADQLGVRDSTMASLRARLGPRQAFDAFVRDRHELDLLRDRDDLGSHPLLERPPGGRIPPRPGVDPLGGSLLPGVAPSREQQRVIDALRARGFDPATGRVEPVLDDAAGPLREDGADGR